MPDERPPWQLDSATATPTLRRGVQQWLEGWRRAGLQQLPRGVSPSTREAAQAAVTAADAGGQLEVRDAVDLPVQPAGVRVAPPVDPSPRSASPPTVMPRPATPSPAPSATTGARSTQSRTERGQQLAQLAERVRACTRCSELARSRTQTVFGVGDPRAKVMFIGEAPGADEDLQGEPFVGRAGQLLNKIIAACGWKREDLYICNILRCRPPGNRTPSPQEAAHCREYLDGQIAVVDPAYIVCWGSVAAQNLLSMTDPIGKLRGRFFAYGRAKVLCTYHPSYLLRNPEAKKPVWEDMQLLLQELGQTPPQPGQSSSARDVDR